MTADRPQVVLEPFEARRHGRLLRSWLERPYVSRWWGEPEQTYGQALERPPGGGHAVILADAEPVGYLRWQRPSRAELEAAGLTEIPDGAVDVDVMIGEESHLGRGIGPRALRLLVARLAADRTVPLVGLTTSVDNLRAQRAFEKAGFARIRTFDDGDYGTCWLMTADLSPWRR